MLPPPTMAQGITPFSDLMAPKYTSSIFGNSFPIIANMLYWLWFINFNLGIFNALPIGPAIININEMGIDTVIFSML